MRLCGRRKQGKRERKLPSFEPLIVSVQEVEVSAALALLKGGRRRRETEKEKKRRQRILSSKRAEVLGRNREPREAQKTDKEKEQLERKVGESPVSPGG